MEAKFFDAKAAWNAVKNIILDGEDIRLWSCKGNSYGNAWKLSLESGRKVFAKTGDIEIRFPSGEGSSASEPWRAAVEVVTKMAFQEP